MSDDRKDAPLLLSHQPTPAPRSGGRSERSRPLREGFGARSGGRGSTQRRTHGTR